MVRLVWVYGIRPRCKLVRVVTLNFHIKLRMNEVRLSDLPYVILICLVPSNASVSSVVDTKKVK